MISSWTPTVASEDASSSGSDTDLPGSRSRWVLVAGTLLAGAAVIGATGPAGGVLTAGLGRGRVRSESLAASSLAAAECSAKGDDCTASRCCADPLTSCFSKDEGYAVCWADCAAGVHETDPVEYRTPWSCEVLAPDAPPDTAVSEPFRCDEGFDDWQEAWSTDMKAWCCQNKQMGCPGDSPPQPASDPYACDAGFNNWQAGWSDAKKQWCCANQKMGCPGDSLPQPASDPYACDAGFNNWQAGWSDAKKQWCCANKNMGCPGDPLPAAVGAAPAAAPAAAAPAAAAPAPASPALGAAPGGCMCLFDVDRTLTAKQSETCGRPVPGVTDTAFGGGGMRLSEVGQDVAATACGACKKGIISAGAADGNGERGVLAAQLGLSDAFYPAGGVSSPLVFGCGNGVKQNCARDILDWMEASQGIKIEPKDVYFFDDLAENIPHFADQGMNAHQISCAGRDGDIGLCGATKAEIRLERGITLC